MLDKLCVYRQDSLAEWSKALAQGASPQGRGFEPHSCHLPCALAQRAIAKLFLNDAWAEYTNRAHGVVVSHPLSMREALGSIPSVSMLRFTPDICSNRAKTNTCCTFCTLFAIPAIAQLVEHLTVDPAAIRWSLVRFRVAGHLEKRDVPTSQRPACCTSKGTPGFEPGTC